VALNNHFDVAHIVGHAAFEHLATAISVYDNAKQISQFDTNPYSGHECLGVSLQLHYVRKDELKHCFQAILLFQSMMEIITTFIPNFGAGMQATAKVKFRPRWEDLLSQIQDAKERQDAEEHFDFYFKNFYNNYRNPIIHAKNDTDLAKINKIRVPGVYEGMRRGWRAYDYLLAKAYSPDQDHDPSWKNMCDIHKIPDTLDLSSYPDLEVMERKFIQKHSKAVRT